MNEEQSSEVEALASIYGDDFVAPTTAEPSFSVRLLPDQTGSSVNHVAATLHVSFPSDYPAAVAAVVRVEAVKGLDETQLKALQKLADDSAAANVGMPAVYTVAEEVRAWLQEHNNPADEGSAFDEMMRRQRDKEKQAQQKDAGGSGKLGSAYSREADPSLAAARGNKVVLSASSEDEVIRRKKEGTPVTMETFLAWRERFEREAAAKAAEEAVVAAGPGGAAKIAAAAIAAAEAPVKLTGKQLFESDASLATSDLASADAGAASGAGASASAAASGEESALLVDAELFAGEEDLEGLDELDFGDDEDEDDEDDEDYMDEGEEESEDEEDSGDDEAEDAKPASAAKAGAAAKGSHSGKAAAGAGVPAAAGAGGKTGGKGGR
jgi:hypothetical protein